MTRVPVIRIALVAVAAFVAAIYLGFGILTARETLGCDFFVYRAAAEHFLAGQPIYDRSITSTGSCNLYYYPPPFVLIAVPFALPSPEIGNAAWMAFLVVCYVAGCLSMPVRWEVKLAIFLLGAVSWPFIFGVRIGQVAPILFLLFAVGWRYVERPVVTGVSAGLGVLVKLQPIVVLGWLAARRSWSGVVAGVAAAVGVSAVAAAVGLGSWPEMVSVLRGLNNALDAPANISLGAMAYQHSLGLQVASAVSTIGTIAVLGLVVACAIASSAEAGFLVAVVASQLVSPIIWTHYALILLLPTAWLLQRRHWWAVLVPLSQAWVLLPFMPIEIYPIGFYALLVAVPLVDWRQRRRREAAVVPHGVPSRA